MKVVISIDSFKGSLTSIEAANAIAEGILKSRDAEIIIRPIADGGEGTVEALTSGLNGEIINSEVTGPLGDKVIATWGIIEVDGIKTAIIEMAAAAGIALIARENLNPLNTTTYGVGELIRIAISRGIRNFVIGIGGSSTNDGGVGMLEALGFDFRDEQGMRICKGAKGLKDLKTIDDADVIPELKDCRFKVACDVTNPLCGDMGCSRVYGPQKGATEEMIKDMDSWLLNYARISGGDKDYPGAGAAGGMGYAFKTFTNATLERGIDIILSEIKLESLIKDADIVITGEGKMDSQTAMGKAPIGVAKLAKKHGKKVIAFCGCASNDAEICNEYGIDAFFPILRNVVTLEEAIDKNTAAMNLSKTAAQVFRLI